MIHLYYSYMDFLIVGCLGENKYHVLLNIIGLKFIFFNLNFGKILRFFFIAIIFFQSNSNRFEGIWRQ